MNKINQGIILFKMNRSLLSDYFLQNSSICSFKSSDSWVVLSPIELSIKQKIEAIGTPLKDWDIQINYGIKTGFNEAFIIDGEKRAELIAADTKCAEIIRPILRGRDIKRYNYEFADLWLINTHNGIKEKGISRIDIDDYPTIKAHLDQYWDQISTRADKGDTPYNLRNCAYMDDFNKQKIVWKIIGNQMAFAIDYNGYIVNNACYILTGQNLKFLLAVLNSKAIKWYSYITNMNKTGVGDVQVGGQNVNLFPIPNLTDKEQEPFTELIDQILIKKRQDKNILDLEQKIENLVYAMYGIITEEIKVIESS